MPTVSKFLQLTDAFQTVHTVGPQDRLTVERLFITNTSNGAKTVQVCFVPKTTPATSPTAANALLWDYSLNANTYVDIELSYILSPDYTVQALASASNVVNVFLTGS